MDLIATVRDAFDRVTKRQKLYHSVSQVAIDQICERIEEALNQIQSDNNGVLLEPEWVIDPEWVLTELRHKLDSLLPTIQLQVSQKETNMNLTKYVKALEKSFHLDISRACRSIDFNVHLVNKILVEHFYRQGLFEIGDSLVKEADVEVETEVVSQLLEIHRLTKSLKLGDIEPAMRWISANRGKLKENGSNLEVKLTSLKYIEFLKEGNRNDALKYARTHFPQYFQLHKEEVQKLMTCLLWIGNLSISPYAKMVSSLTWDNIAQEITKEYYHLLDEPLNSPLEVALSAGLDSLPTLLKLVHVMDMKKQDWQAMKQLPVPLELRDEFQFHSVFVCPVSRDQSNEENPPMMMPCLHVLCKQSIMKLSKNCPSRRFKCPYCPKETTAAACRQLYL